MIFTEFRFLLFFGVVFCLHWMLRTNQQRKILLLVSSYVFYGAWDWRFLFLIFTSTVVDYFAAAKLHATDDEKKRKRWLLVSLVVNLGLLGLFKYFNFFIDSAGTLLEYLDIPFQMTTLEILLPVGISFYTFQTLSYSIDIYRRNLEPTQSFLDMMLFVSFFPQLVAGPIVRAVHFLPQLLHKTSLSKVDIKGCLVLFLIGYFKKAVVSDTISPTIDEYFSNNAAFDSLAAWIACTLFAVQVYADFSGYSDMAIATAGLLGYHFGRNFAFPFFARNLAMFWRRWHISLSGWLRDYLFIPLGGSRGSAAFVMRNLMITMVLSGLWHGAGWNYILFGFFHGGGLGVHYLWRRWRGKEEAAGLVGAVCCFVTFSWFAISMAFFRAPDNESLIEVWKGLCFLSSGTQTIDPRWFLPVAALAICHWLSYRNYVPAWWEKTPTWLFALGYGVAVELCLAFSAPVAEPFVYFQF